MTMEQMLYAFLATLRDHIQLPGYEWAPTAATAGIALIGLLLMIRGAKWAPGVGGLGFLALGGVGGHFLSLWLGTPQWPTVGITAVGAFALGLALFRIWQAVILAGCFIVAALGAYYAHDLTPAVNAWLGDGATAISIPEAGTVVGTDAQSAWIKAQSLFSHLSTTVPNFQFNFWALAAGAGVAGLALGLVLPRASRSLWAATIGTIMLGMGATGLMQTHAPQALDWLLADNVRAWSIVGGTWLASFAWNLVTSGPRRAKEAVGPPSARPAIA
jgi:hypothetical protein